MRRTLPVVLAGFLVACGGGGEVGSPNPPPPPPPFPPTGTGPNALIIQDGNNQQAAPGEAVSTLPTVQVVDRNGQPMAGISVKFAVDAGGGTVTGDFPTTGADGKASPTSWVLGSLPGENRLRVTSGTLTPVLVTATGRLLVATSQVTGTVGPPAGSRLELAKLRIQSGLMDVPVGADGSYTGVVDAGIITLASAVAANGNPVLFGWIDQSKKNLTARTTAEVMAFFDMNGYLQINRDARRIIRDYLAAGADLHELESAITAALAADPATVTLATPAIIAARKSVLARFRALAPARLVIDPAATQKSGVIVDQTGFNGVIATNNWRRRVAWFVDRVSYVPKGATGSVPSLNRGAGMELDAVSAATSVIGTALDIAFGNLPYTPVVSEPVRLDRFPVDARSTTYRVTVVGPGGVNSATPLTAEQQQAGLTAGLETLILEFILPMADQVLSTDNLARSLGGAAEVESIVHDILDVNPLPLLTAVGSGDIKAAFLEASKLMFDSGAGQEVVEDVVKFLCTRYGLASTEAVAARFKKFSNVLTAAEILATSIASAQAAADYLSASEGESWDVTVTGSEVNIDPKETTISQLEIQLLRAQILDAKPEEMPVIGYRWTTTGRAGKLCAALQGQGPCGLSFESSQDVVSYAAEPNQEGTDDIKVEAYVKEGNRKIPIGEGTAKITTFAVKVELSPTSEVLESGEFAEFTATLDSRVNTTGALITYKFSTPGALGYLGLDQTSIESGTPSATYTAKMEVGGTEPLTVEVFKTKDGIRQRLGSATAMIAVEKVKPTVVHGRYFSEVHSMPNNRVCAGAYIAFPLVEGAVYYQMRAYNFNDPLFWGTEINFPIFLESYGTWDTCDLKGFISGRKGNEFIYMLTGGSGPAATFKGLGPTDARFTGIKIDVTVRYNP